MKIVYIAGKYRGDNINEIYENIQLARQHSAKLWRLGYAVLCPHMNTALMDGAVSDETFLQGAKEMLKRCDYIYLLPNWEISRGAIEERILAIQCGIPELKIDLYAVNVRTLDT